MGIKVKKAIGYGLLNVKKDDPRILLKNIDDIFKKKLEDFREYLPHSQRFSVIDKAIENKALFSDFIHYEPESGKDILLFQVPGFDWTRRDDTIDYIEETYNHRQRTRIEVYDRGIYPYNIQFVNKNTGKLIACGSEWMQWHLLKIECAINGNTSKYITANQMVYDLSKQVGFKDYTEARNSIIPMIPKIIILLCEWLKLFKDPMTVYELKPMLYIYWS